MKRKISLFAAGILLLSFGFSALPVISARALDSTFIAEYDGVQYYGDRLDATNVRSFKGEADLAASGLDSPIIEFLITPSTRGSGTATEAAANPELYTPDFEWLNITFTEKANASNALSVKLRTRNSDDRESIAINAGGTGQIPAGEFLGNAGRLGTNLGGMIPYYFDGYAREEAGRFLTADGSTTSIGAHGSIRLYYESSENALYADMGYRDNPSFTAPGGGYRWRIRDFGKDDYTGVDAGSVWSGFTSGETEVTISFANVVAGKSPSILLISLGGEKMMPTLSIEKPSDGVANCAYPIPSPMYYDASDNAIKDFIENGGTYKVLSPSGDVAVDSTALTALSNFLPTESGQYTIEYALGDDTLPMTVDIYADGTVGTLITTATDSGITYIGETLEIGATATNSLQVAVPTVYLTINRDGVEVEAIAPIATSRDYLITTAGAYEFVYTSTDYIGRLTTKTVSVDARRYYAITGENIEYNAIYDSGAEVPTPSITDFMFYDLVSLSSPALTSHAITVAYNGGSPLPLAEANFSQEGVYTINYTARYIAFDSLVTASATRLIYVLDSRAPEIRVSAAPRNSRLVGGATVSDPIVELKAVSGTTLVFPYGFFAVDGDITVQLNRGGTISDITSHFAGGSYSLAVESGEYTITAIVVNKGYRTVKALSIDVRNKWYSASNVADRQVSLGTSVVGLMPTITDYYGNPVSGGTVSVSFNGNSVGGEGFTPSAIGEYIVEYSLVRDGETVRGTYVITSVDTDKPVITLSGGKKTAYKGKFVPLAVASVTDASTVGIRTTVTVTKNGNEVLRYNDGFLADETGVYEVVYTSVDLSGNTAIVKYEVTVRGWGLVIGLSVGGGVVLLAAAAAVTTIIIVKKRKRSEQNV